MNGRNLILLDLGGVVFQSSSSVLNEKINWEIIHQLNNKYGRELNLGADLFPDFISDYNSLSHQNLTGRQFLESIFSVVIFNKELIEILRPFGDIIVVSDNYRENIEYINETYNISNWAVKEIYSYKYKLFKSNPQFFEKLLSELGGFEKNRLILIDDDQKNIQSAEKFGIIGVLYENNDQIEKRLKAIGKDH